MYQEFSEPTSMLLNTAPPQFTSGGNKTQNAMDYIRHYSMLHNTSANGKEHGYHHITCIFTNNSLAETEQWIYRTGNEFSNTNIFILSSKKKETKDEIKFKTREQLAHYIVHAERNALPDIIIMCSNTIRIHDICELIDDFKKGVYNITYRTGYKGITFNIMIDEADKNIGAIKHLLHSGHVRQTQNNAGPLLDVMFITATPFDNFWKMLNDVGIDKLKMDWLLNQWADKGVNYEFLDEGYRQITDHTHIPEENLTSDPVEYIRDVFERIDYPTRRIIYAPASRTTITHDEVSEFFIERNFIVLIHNGTNKEFRFPHEAPIKLETYKKENNINGELRDVLVHITNSPEYRKYEIAITGCLTIERGITFNTTDFQFTHMILSSYHANNKATMVQMFGRGNGSSEYVGTFNIICPSNVLRNVTTAIENMKSIFLDKPQEVSYDDFKNITDPNSKCKTVPIVHPITSAQYGLLKKPNVKTYDRVFIKSLLSIYEWTDEYMWYESSKVQGIQLITTPDPAKSSYKKHITDIVIKAESNMRGVIDAGAKIKGLEHRKLMWIFIDKVNLRFIITRWDGSKYKSREN